MIFNDDAKIIFVLKFLYLYKTLNLWKSKFNSLVLENFYDSFLN